MKKQYIRYGKSGVLLLAGLLLVLQLLGCSSRSEAEQAPEMQIQETQVQSSQLSELPEEEEVRTTGKTVEEMLGLGDSAPRVEYDGEIYRKNPAVDSYLLMGVDQAGEAKGSGSYNGGGQTDVMLLLVMDHTQKKYTVLQLNRDTMVYVDILGVRGDIVGSNAEQLALAHARGTGMKDSCENAARAVSNLLYGAEIDGYASLRMDAVKVLNDGLGGVPVYIEDDFSQSDPALVQGETIRLQGDQALRFIRARMEVGDGTNESRMRRNRTYMESFRTELENRMNEDPQILLKLYDDVFPYMVTNIGSATVEKIAKQCRSYQSGGIVTLAGESYEGEEFMEFYLDDNSAREMSLQLFYIKESQEN